MSYLVTIDIPVSTRKLPSYDEAAKMREEVEELARKYNLKTRITLREVEWSHD